ncbi:pyrroloquinoline quinone-dependent dehydrogenase [Novosphingobium sp.]|uniref:pyrroloquinoline quinone-dependent dehydrogenase n=1 Tax=Novosphingobium sp. TaxID=1874826 RepID=UPI0035B09105
MKYGWLALGTAMLVAPAMAQTDRDAAREWRTYGHDKGGQRHSPLTQITPANAARLAPAWTWHMRPPGDPAAPAADANAERQAQAEGLAAPRRRARFAASQVTPLVVDGRMYLTTPYGRVVALDAASGRELWATPIPTAGQPSIRGLEYWPGDGEHGPRLFLGTRDGLLVALDAQTGAFAAGFGQQGMVELKTPEVLNGASPRFYGMTSPPIVFENLVITGSAVQEFPDKGAAGDVRAWDARTGQLVWTFHSVPRPGEPNHGTWSGGEAQRSGVNVWGFLTLDAARGIVYMPFAAPSWDRYGGDRKGDNLYSGSLVAADARTGKYLWHFQVIRHDIWDNDLQAPPLLLDMQVKGRTVPAVAVVSKNALLFVLDRVTGKPILPVAQRRFPGSQVPGEAAAPTQPYPLVTPPLGRTAFKPADLARLTPEHTAACQAWIDKDRLQPGGLYVPVPLDRPIISFPGTLGGANWGGATYDPARQLLLVNTMDFGQVQSLVRAKPGSPFPYERGPVFGRFVQSGTRLPCQAPPWGRLSAVDMRSGRIAWAVPLGVTDSLPEGKRQTGRPNIGGAISTAGGVTFIGATDDARFRAFATATGKLLWEVKLDAAAHATPITWAGPDGRQYVAIASSGGSFLDSPLTGDSLSVFALPPGEQ